MMKNDFKYPPCQINGKTERPYPRHKWVINGTRPILLKKGEKQEVVHYMRVVCSRCGFSDPHPPTN